MPSRAEQLRSQHIRPAAPAEDVRVGGRAAALRAQAKATSPGDSVAEEIRTGQYRDPLIGLLDYTPLGLAHNAVSGRSFSSRVDPYVRSGFRGASESARIGYDAVRGVLHDPETQGELPQSYFAGSDALAKSQESAGTQAAEAAGTFIDPVFLATGLGAGRAGARLGLRGYNAAAFAGGVDAGTYGAAAGFADSEDPSLEGRIGSAVRGGLTAAPVGALAGIGLEKLGRAALGRGLTDAPEGAVLASEDRAAADAMRAAARREQATAAPHEPAMASPAAPVTRRARRAVAAGDSTPTPAQLESRELARAGVPEEVAARIADPPMVKAAKGEQMALFSDPVLIQATARLVGDGLKAGKWVTGHTIAASRWLASRGADAISSVQSAAKELIRQFGQSIRKHVPRIWRSYRDFAASRNVPSRRNVGAVGAGVSPRRLARKVESLTARIAKTETRAREQVAKIKGLQAAKVERYDTLVKMARAALPQSEQHVALGAFHKVRTPAAFDKAVAKLETQVARVQKRAERIKEFHTAVQEMLPPDKRAGMREQYKRLDTDADLARALNKIVERREGLDAARASATHIGKIKKQMSGRLMKQADRYPAVAEQAAAVRAMGIDPAAGWNMAARKAVTRLPVNQQAEAATAVKALRDAIRSAKAAPQKRIEAHSRKVGKEIAESIRQSRGERYAGEPGQKIAPSAGLAKRFFNEWHLLPETIAETTDPLIAKHVYEPIVRAKRSFYRLLRHHAKRLEDAYAEIGLAKGSAARNKWESSVSGRKATVSEYELASGDTLKITPAERMYLAAAFDDTQTADLIRKGAPIELSHSPQKQYAITEGDIAKIVEGMSREEREIVAAMKRTLQEQAPELDKAWVAMRGHALTDNPTYWMRRRGGQESPKDMEALVASDLDGRVENRGLTKARTGGTERSIVIGDALSEFDRHLQQSVAVARMARPAQAVQAVLRHKPLKDAMTAAYGRQRPEYFERWVQDVMEDAALFRQPLRSAEHEIGQFVDRVQRGVLAANPGVILKQTPSLLNAGTEIEAKYLTPAIKAAVPGTRAYRESVETMMQHSPEIWARYDMHAARLSGVLSADMNTATKSNRRIGEKLMAGITYADRSVVATIWDAARRKVADTQPGLSGDAYWSAVDDIASKVIRRTQPNFDFTNLSSVSRSARYNPVLKMFTMFMSQRNTNYNMIYRAMRSGDPKRLAAVLGVVAVAQPMLITAIDDMRSWSYGNERPGDETLAWRGLDYGLASAENVAGNLFFSGHVTALSRHLRQKYIQGQNARFRDPQTPVAGQVGLTVSGLLDEIAAVDKAIENDGWSQSEIDRGLRGVEKMMLGGAGLAGVPASSPYRTVRGIYRGVFPGDEE